MDKKLSVVIPTWNGKDLLKISLNSLKDQTNTNFEIIVVDNGSSDSTVEYLEKNFPEVIILALEKNIGFAAAVNKGIKKAKNEYVFLLNNDIELQQNCVENIINDLINSDAEILGCRMMDFKERNIVLDAGNTYSIYGLVIQEGRMKKSKNNEEKIVEIFSACAGAAIYKKQIFDNIGYFDEDFFAYLEDVDMGFRAQLQEYKVLISNRSIAYHMEGATSNRFSDLKEFYSLRNNLYLIFKNFPTILLIILSPLILLYQFRTFLVFMRHRKINIFFNAYSEFFKTFPKTLKKRKQIQSNKRVTSKYILKKLSKEVPFKIIKQILK